ncbi:unnamed protein product [Lactuca saligna]|uniref:Uncharacterized protein n=1 Tax=Lactuca saligna TaxID=75948 RepID=A0AA35VQZ4_LACSI|nr:unnamed protein product [Lactuca saligna]
METPPTSTQMADPSTNMDTTSRMPPLPVSIPTFLPSDSTSVARSSNEARSSLTHGGSSPPRPAHDAAFERLARLLAQQDSDPSPCGKGISIGEGNVGGEEPSIVDLRVEIGVLTQKIIEKNVLIGNINVQVSKLEEENILTSNHIYTLQVNLGALTAGYYDLKNKLIAEFGDKTTRIVERFEKEPEQANPRITIKRAGKHVTSQKMGMWLFMKNFDQNLRGDQPQLTMTELEKKRFKHKYSDWLGILDLTEISEAPFSNSSNDPRANDFKLFLENQVRRGFDGMKTTEFFLKTVKDVFDLITNKSFENVMWHPTKQMKKIPIIKNFCDGSLCNMQYWVYDDATTTAIIKFKDGVFHLVDKKYLLQFGERDIHNLAAHQILCNQEIIKVAAKEFTSMIAKIIEKKMWLGAMGRSDVLVIEKD